MEPRSSFRSWLPEQRRLAVAFDGLADSERDTFRKTLSLRRVEIPGKGTYDNVSLEDVPLAPASARDAQRWAVDRFDRHLSAKPAYRCRAEVREQFAQLNEETPLEPFAPTLAAHEELLSLSVNDPERFWSLAAPVDLSPFPPAADELGPLRIGSPAPITSFESSKGVRIPYRGGWSMRQLVDRLVSGVSPRRVLLCDRYVRGDDNLETLRLLVAALRAASSNVAIDVWTSDEEGDFKTIESITGATPRSYRDAFGRSMPHDRYLLVRTGHGEGFGWQMSNSPIHARSDIKGAGPETPLRWKDLAATRVGPDELEPALRHWLTGGGR